MPFHPYKIRIRQVRDDLFIEYLTPVGRSRWAVRESVNMGPVLIEEAVKNLEQVDKVLYPRLAAAFIPEIT